MASKPKVVTLPLKEYLLFTKKIEKELYSLENSISATRNALDDLYSAEETFKEEGK